jgi:hypothetical protein
MQDVPKLFVGAHPMRDRGRGVTAPLAFRAQGALLPKTRSGLQVIRTGRPIA